MKKILTLCFLILTIVSKAQNGNVGIGNANPENKLQVNGNFAVSQPFTNTVTPPTQAQTKTMVNGSTLLISGSDSTGRIYDPGGPSGNYIDNLNATINISGFGLTVGIAFTIEDLDLGTGDSLLLKSGSTILAFGKANQTKGRYVLNGASASVVFKSNTDGVDGRGFSLLYNILYPGPVQPTVNGFTGNTFYFNTATGVLRAGSLDQSETPGSYSTAMGNSMSATGASSTAAGYHSKASGDNSSAFGYFATAGGANSFAAGSSTTASGDNSMAMGSNAIASGVSSTTIGDYTTASGDYSVAFGRRVSTAGFKGAFFFGDSDPNNKGTRTVGIKDQFAARFNGGYYFISGDAGSDVGVRVLPGSNSWSTISDINRKENFVPVDGEEFLQKIAAFNLSSWNYKGQNAKTFRHYGPMAQEFYAAFGKDEYGTIGCDTLINQQDFLGVNLIAIQALEKRTEKIEVLEKENEELKTRLDKLEKLIANKL